MLEEYLETLGGDASLIGYEYLIDSINIFLQHKEFKHSLYKYLYPEVAKIHKTSSSAIVRGIERYIATTNKSNMSIGKFIKELELKFRKK